MPWPGGGQRHTIECELQPLGLDDGGIEGVRLSLGAPLHDPCVIAWLLQPDLFTGRDINVSIETVSELTMGMTVADWWRVTDRPANALFLRDGNADGYYQLLTERLARLP